MNNSVDLDPEMSKVLQYLAPWIEKTNGEEEIGSWETMLATKMMMKLLELWLTQDSREQVEKMLEYYHPLDRAAMAYALVVYVMTGTKMTFKSAVANQHYKIICKMLKDDMPELMFAGHIKYMMRRYGKKKAVIGK
jgi:hypothetical protein